MRLSRFASIFVAALILSASAARAQVVHLTTVLSPANEVPPTVSTGTGIANVDLNLAAQTLRVNVIFSGLVPTTAAGAPSGTTASHIHCCLPSPLATDMNAGVATTTPTFPGFPLGVLSGSYDQTFDLTQASTYNPAFVTLQGSLASAEAALINGLLNGLTYLNVHTTAFPNGEIRGFLVAAAIPEADSYAMLLAGLGLLGLVARRREKRASPA
ncbi:MAG: hypothetical protein JWN94_4657 [Betaproteobacteria bacterium]|nr:hypothetical protein [Betaproteobacteria bacterium]